MLCQWGCGLESTHISKSGKHTCAKSWTQCPIGRLKRADLQRERMKDSNIREALAMKTKEIKTAIDPETGLTQGTIASRKSANTRKSTIDPTSGTTIAKTLAAKAVETKRNTIDPITGKNVLEAHGERVRQLASTVCPFTGLTNAQKSGLKGGHTRSTKIDEDSGLRVAQLIGKKRHATMVADIDENGINGAVRSAIKGAQTKRLTRDENGLSIAVLAGLKDRDAKLADIDENGLNGYDRRDIVAKTVHYYKDTGVFYQGSYELQFLTEFEKANGIDELERRVQRGPSIPYFDTVTSISRVFRPDFIVDGCILHEIKSTFVMNQEGGPITLWDKLSAAETQGYSVILVLDKMPHDWKLLKL